MRKIKVLFVIICFPCFVFGQKWQEYSDSIFVYFKNNNINKTLQFIKLSDLELAKGNFKRDTIYADYIYRKAVVQSSLNDFNTSLLKQSLEIWANNTKKNYLKIMKIYYFLGVNYYLTANQTQNINDFKNSYKYFELSYKLIKKYNYQSKSNYLGILSLLSNIDYQKNKNFKKSKKIAKEYINYVKVYGIEDFNFDYFFVLGFAEDFKGQELLLKEYLIKYDTKKLNDPELLFKIYYQLFYVMQKAENYFENISEIINFGKKAVEINKTFDLKNNNELTILYSGLEIYYGQIKDNVNQEKYRKLHHNILNKNNEIDYYDELEELYRAEDYTTFKLKFDEYEEKFIKENKFSDLLEIYKYSLTLFERSILFNKENISKQLKLIEENKNLLTFEDKLLFDSMIIEFNLVIGEFNKALELCNENLNVKDLDWKLKFYKYKIGLEDALGFKEKAIKNAEKTLKIATESYGENDLRLLPFLEMLLDLDLMGTNPNLLKFETKILEILYKNKLEKTVSAISIWQTLGQKSILRNDLQDALIYFKKSFEILENTKTINNPNLYLSSYYRLINVYVQQNKFDKAKELLDRYKKYLDDNSNLMSIQFEGYYYSLGNYYFQQDKFLEAKENYEKSFKFYNNNSSKKVKYFLCNYFLENNVNELIKNITQYNKENKDTSWGQSLLYLLKYNSGDFDSAKNVLENQLNKLIIDNNKYFHLLSNNEKENLYKSFTNQFEFLNSYLLDSDLKFLKKYINFRFYSKSLLFSNLLASSILDEKNKDLYIELKNNTKKINKAIESNSNDIIAIEALKNKNREIEKFLSKNNTPLSVPNLKDLKKKLKQDEAYVEIIRINKQSQNSINKPAEIINFFTDSIIYGAIIIKKNKNPKFIIIDDSNQLEKNYVVNFNFKIRNKQHDEESYPLLFEKLDNELSDTRKIFMVTDGVYNSINIESIYNPKRKKHLIEYLKVRLIQNVNTIIDEKIEFKFDLSTKTTLFGNPDFDILLTNSQINHLQLERDLNQLVFDKIKSTVKISRLYGTQKEIEKIEDILKESKSKIEVFTKANATEDNLKIVQSPNILHIATHGYFLTNEDASNTKKSIANLINDSYKIDSYLKSGLLLAGAQNTLNGKQLENSNNGILTAEEAKSLNLKDTELVVLSACETGLGDNLVGQGVVGLQRAFMIAGAKSVIMSLWSVSDEKTQELMTLFYTNWIKKNMSKEESLFQAKIEMKKLYPDPFYWAGFVLLE